MKRRFVITGHAGFYNRGCEAILRSTISLIQQNCNNAKIILYSYNHESDKSELKDKSIDIHPLNPSNYNAAWFKNMSIRRFPGLVPIYGKITKYMSSQPDVCLSIGGDNYTFDYGFPIDNILMDRFYMAQGVPVVIWGASIGPFESGASNDKKIMREHLQSVDLITARESVTVDYLKSMDVTSNVVKVFDPAFLLETERYDGPEKTFPDSGNVIGLNVSALIVKWRADKNMDSFLDEISDFIETAISEGFKIMLIPHVTKKDGPLENDDETTLQLVYSRIKDGKEKVTLLPGGISAQKAKWMISQCQYFIGARTHSTIAALSTGVPTISIAYSQKAIGINRDIFGHEEYVLHTPKVSKDTLLEKLKLLQKREKDIRGYLKDKIPEMLDGAKLNYDAINELLAKKNQE